MQHGIKKNTFHRLQSVKAKMVNPLPTAPFLDIWAPFYYHGNGETAAPALSRYLNQAVCCKQEQLTGQLETKLRKNAFSHLAHSTDQRIRVICRDQEDKWKETLRGSQNNMECGVLKSVYWLEEHTADILSSKVTPPWSLVKRDNVECQR